MKSTSPQKKKTGRPKTGKKKMVSYQELRELQRIREVSHMGPGTHQPFKEFGSDVKHKMHFMGRKEWKPDSNPPPGIYDPSVALTKSSSQAVVLTRD